MDNGSYIIAITISIVVILAMVRWLLVENYTHRQEMARIKAAEREKIWSNHE